MDCPGKVKGRYKVVRIKCDEAFVNRLREQRVPVHMGGNREGTGREQGGKGDKNKNVGGWREGGRKDGGNEDERWRE